MRSTPKRPESRPTPESAMRTRSSSVVVERTARRAAPAEAHVARPAARGGPAPSPAGEVVVDEPGSAPARERVANHRVQPLAVPPRLVRGGSRRRAAWSPRPARTRRPPPCAGAAAWPCRRSSSCRGVLPEPVDDLLVARAPHRAAARSLAARRAKDWRRPGRTPGCGRPPVRTAACSARGRRRAPRGRPPGSTPRRCRASRT